MTGSVMSSETVQARMEDRTCFLTLHRPEARNAINRRMIDDCHGVLDQCDGRFTVVVVEGMPDVFCMGADFDAIAGDPRDGAEVADADGGDAARLYELWLRLANGPYVTVAHVRGKANAGGVGFAAACDIIVAGADAEFSLSELLFGLFPACVMPFLVRRVGVQRAHYLALMTKPFGAEQALAWGLVDACDRNSDRLLQLHLRRLRYLSAPAIAEYKRYMSRFNGLAESAGPAIGANRKMFSDPANLEAIRRYVATGRFPWDA